MCFSETVDNFVDKSLRVLDVAKKELLNVRLGNQGPVSGDYHRPNQIKGLGLVWITSHCCLKISGNRL
jgi:hypothetical protein